MVGSKTYTNENSRDNNRQGASLHLVFKQQDFYEKASRDASFANFTKVSRCMVCVLLYSAHMLLPKKNSIVSFPICFDINLSDL